MQCDVCEKYLSTLTPSSSALLISWSLGAELKQVNVEGIRRTGEERRREGRRSNLMTLAKARVTYWQLSCCPSTITPAKEFGFLSGCCFIWIILHLLVWILTITWISRIGFLSFYDFFCGGQGGRRGFKSLLDLYKNSIVCILMIKNNNKDCNYLSNIWTRFHVLNLEC